LLLRRRRQRCPSLFPYTTLFRSGERGRNAQTYFPFSRRTSSCRRTTVSARWSAGTVSEASGSGNFIEKNPFALQTSKISSAFTGDRKSTRLNSSHVKISYAVFCL